MRGVERHSGFLELLALAAAFGEGVARSFRGFLPRLPAELSDLARKIGWGINAYFTDLGLSGDDLTLMRRLGTLADTADTAPDDRESLRRLVESSDFATTIFDADAVVTGLVDQEVSAAVRQAPWLEVPGLPVYLVEVDSPRRIVHLVASATRTRLDHGVVVSRQDTRTGVSIELRRARSLAEPDLAAILLGLSPEWFVSRGGHPMAAGATLVPEHADRALAALRESLAVSGNRTGPA